MVEEMPSPGRNWEWTPLGPGVKAGAGAGTCTDIWTQHEKSPLAEPLGKGLGKLSCASQFELNQSVRNGEINQHNKTRCRKPGGSWGVGSFGILGSAGTPGATQGVQYKQLWGVAPRSGKSWMTRWIHPTLNLSICLKWGEFSLHGIIYSTAVPFDSIVSTLLVPVRMPQEHLEHKNKEHPPLPANTDRAGLW